MSKVKDLTNQRFGRLVVIERAKSTDGRSRWLCLCECGNMSTPIGYHLSIGHTVSCGCSVDALSSARSCYGAYERRAKCKQLVFTLTFDDWYNITQQNCVYCGKQPAQVYKVKSCSNSLIYNGVDRRDNVIGYTLENSFACCGDCNRAKGTMAHDDFIALCKRIVERW